VDIGPLAGLANLLMLRARSAFPFPRLRVPGWPAQVNSEDGMRIHLKKLRLIGGLTGAVVATMALIAPAANGGGFAVREQSTEFQGMSFAGSAAGGGGLSTMFWNPAGLGHHGAGMKSESHYAYIIPDAEITVLPGSTLGGAGTSVDIGRDAIVPSSYAAIRIAKDTVFGLGINAPFGLGTEVSNPLWAGQLHHRSAKLTTYNFNPALSYELRPGLWIGAGLQLEYINLRLKQAALPNGPTSVLRGEDVGIGATAGLMWQPREGTTVGFGWRSSVHHTITDGDAFVVGSPAPHTKIDTSVSTPDIITFSVRQSVHQNMRLMGTVEFTHWSKFNTIPVISTTGATVALLEFNWHDGWLFALGGEYDWSEKMTLRGGVAFEISPIQNAAERLVQVPDSDRWWLSVGASYRYSETMTFDFAYSHVFFDGGPIDRRPASPLAAGVVLLADSNQSADILSVALKMKLGAPASAHEPMK
jgi:long-chain fatty acid transport protein